MPDLLHSNRVQCEGRVVSEGIDGGDNGINDGAVDDG
jgi:hypothetical protein